MPLLIRNLLLLILIAPLTVIAGIEDHTFDNAEQEALYVRLTKELRCLVCQNQNLADSNADLAKDLREKAYEMVMAGKTRSEITDYMVERYGDFVMYSPPMKNTTYLLWIGPFVFLLLSLILLFVFIRKKSATADSETEALSDADLAAARKLLNNKD